MSIHGLREALRKPHVKAFYLAELGVLRESERPRTFHRLTALRENRNAAVAAAKVLEQISDPELAKPSNLPTPGVTIRIVNVSSPSPLILNMARDNVVFRPIIRCRYRRAG